MMTKTEALKILGRLPNGGEPSRFNPALSQKEIVDIMMGAVNESSSDNLKPWLERRINQVVKSCRSVGNR